jgi:CRP-like cAMP-binding protein
MQDIYGLLIKCSIFNHLSFDEVACLLSNVQYSVKCYKKNEVVFSPHHSPDTLGIILNGSVDVQKIFASGKAITVSKRFQYDLIADASIFANIDCYPSTISACEKSYIFLLHKNNLIKIFSKDEKIMPKFLESVSNRVLALNTTIEILSLGSVSAKIAYYLLSQNKQSINIIKLKFTKKSLAEQLNVSRTTLSRELKNLQLQGIISFRKRTIEIHRLDKLEQLCSI